MHTIEHDHAGAGGALLPLEAKPALHDRHHRLVEIGVVIDDDRVLAPHLGDHPLHEPAACRCRCRGGLGIDRQPHGPRAGEGHERRVGMRDERRPHLLATARKEGQCRGRHTSLEQHLVQPQCDQRRLFGRLHHHRVARHERSRCHAGENRQRKIPRRDHDGHAPGQPRRRILLAGHIHPRWSGQPQRLMRVVAAEVDRLRHIGIGFPPRLANLEDLDGGQFEAAASHDAGRLHEDLGSPLPADGLPRVERLPGRRDRAVSICGRRRRHLRNQPGVIRWVVPQEPVG